MVYLGWETIYIGSGQGSSVDEDEWSTVKARQEADPVLFSSWPRILSIARVQLPGRHKRPPLARLR